MSTDQTVAARRWRQFSLRSLLLLALFCALVGGLVSWWLRPAVLDRGYFPMRVGYRWVYASDSANDFGDVVFEVVGTEKVGDSECFVVVRTIRDQQLKFYVEVDDRGVLIHRVGADRYEPAYRQFAFRSKHGDEWNWKGTIGDEPGQYVCMNYGQHRVSVPLGQWDAFWVAQEAPESDSGDTNFWLVDEIGVAKIQAKFRDKHDPRPRPGESEQFDWQLKEFSRR
jgi:hypothetical protein